MIRCKKHIKHQKFKTVELVYCDTELDFTGKRIHTKLINLNKPVLENGNDFVCETCKSPAEKIPEDVIKTSYLPVSGAQTLFNRIGIKWFAQNIKTGEYLKLTDIEALDPRLEHKVLNYPSGPLSGVWDGEYYYGYWERQ